MEKINLPDGEKIKQFAICQGASGKPVFAFLSEGGSLYVADDQGWPHLEKLNEVGQP